MLQGILEADGCPGRVSACMRFCRPLVARRERCIHAGMHARREAFITFQMVEMADV